MSRTVAGLISVPVLLLAILLFVPIAAFHVADEMVRQFEERVLAFPSKDA